METGDQPSHPDFHHPGDGHASNWIAKPYAVVFAAVGLFVLILGIALFLGWRQFETTKQNARTARLNEVPHVDKISLP
jgi:hypothetical protein